MATVAIGVAASSGTALAQQPATPIIPTAEPNHDENVDSSRVSRAAVGSGPGAQELARPYDEWRGRGLAPPAPRTEDGEPLPLTRPREQPRRPFEITGALAAFLPSCSAGTIDDRHCLTLRPGAGLDVAIVHRVTPFFGVGLEGALSGFGAEGHGAFSVGGGARYAGVVARVYFADSGSWDPHAALALGVGELHLDAARGLEREATSGLAARVSGGVDYRFGAHLRIGPSASFAHWLAYGEERCREGACRAGPAANGRLVGFATLGVRVSASFGGAL